MSGHRRFVGAGRAGAWWLVAGAVIGAPLVACGDDSPWGSYSGSDGGSGSGSSSGSGHKDGSVGGDDDGGQVGDDDGGNPPPPVDAGPIQCNPNANDDPAPPLDFSNNLMASPAPPGNLTPQNAPQIVVFGWDDVESLEGVQFVTSLLGSLNNPATNPNSNSGKASANLNPNACYAYDSAYQCGDGTLQNNRAMVTSLISSNGFAVGNHTIDHLENYEYAPWSGIPSQYKDQANGGWANCSSGPASGFGVGCCMTQDVWKQILPVNESALGNDYSAQSVKGFRAPRLEVNDEGLQALRALGYDYDESLEETLPEGWINAAINANTDGGKGISAIPWPYTLDNGSPGVWNQQYGGGQGYITNFPAGLWETPVYEAYVPSANDLGHTIANTMLNSDDPSKCPFPADQPSDQRSHCYLGDGELTKGQAVTEVTAFDFNTFIYGRMTPDQWLTVMKHTFLLRYYGNRAPLTYGAHPMEYTGPYDSFTLGHSGCNDDPSCSYSAGNPNDCCQHNNFGYRDVVTFNTYKQRQQAMSDFVKWVKSDPNMSKDTYFMSAADLVAFMKKPFDKTGAAVQPDPVASPDSNGLFNRLGFNSDGGAKVDVVSGNAANITFTIPKPTAGDAPEVVYAAAPFVAGAFKNLSHIDIKYNTQVPFRIRLLPDNANTPEVTVLLAGVGGDRVARIRAKDFFPGPEATESQVASFTIVDSSYLSHVQAIVFESAGTQAAPSGTPGTFAGGTFTTKIEQLTLHGVSTGSLCASQ